MCWRWGISYMCKIRLSSVEAKSRGGHTYGTEKGSDGEEIIESGLQPKGWMPPKSWTRHA